MVIISKYIKHYCTVLVVTREAMRLIKLATGGGGGGGGGSSWREASIV